MSNPWDQRPPPVKGNSADEIHLAVGRALTQWERLEYRVSELYGLLVGAHPISSPAMRAFGAVAASSARCAMVVEAADVFPYPQSHQDLKNRLQQFLKMFGQFGARRNEIAHGQAVTIGGDATNILLLPAFYNAKKYDSDDTYRATYKYGAGEITYYQEWFAKLLDQAEALKRELAQMPSPYR